MKWVLPLCALLFADQSPRSVFEVVERVGSLRIVRANQAGATAWAALRSLEAIGCLRLELQVPELRARLERETVSLAIDRMESTTVAEFIAVAAGLDLVTERLEGRDGKPGVLVATVVESPSPKTEAGRRRLQSWSLRWYRNLLRSELRANRETADAAERIRIDIAMLDMAQRNLAAAAQGFRWFIENAPEHPFVPRAMLKEAECLFEMGQLVESARASSRLMKEFSEKPIGVEAAILFSRARIGTALDQLKKGDAAIAGVTLDDVIVNLELFLWNWQAEERFPELMILVARAQRLRGRPDLVLERLRQLTAVYDSIRLPDELWRMRLFLEGDAELASGERTKGRGLLWQYLQLEPKGRYAALAWSRLAQGELVAERPVQALFAARKALELADTMLPFEHSAVLVTEARARFGAGMFDTAVERLRGEIRRLGAKASTDIILFLGEQLLTARRPEEAKTAVASLLFGQSPQADRARILVLEAEAMQGNNASLVKLARDFADVVRAPQLQSRIAELAGDAYTVLGQHRRAAEAYNGRIR